jgi:hypothetical protein
MLHYSAAAFPNHAIPAVADQMLTSRSTYRRLIAVRTRMATHGHETRSCDARILDQEMDAISDARMAMEVHHNTPR